MHSDLLGNLIAIASPKPFDPWEDHKKVISEGGIADADANGFSVEGPLGCTRITFPGGLTEDHYNIFSPPLDDDEKLILAKGVLENNIQSIFGQDWKGAIYLLHHKYNIDLYKAVPEINQAKWVNNLANIVNEIKREFNEYRLANPHPRVQWIKVETPIWEPPYLFFAGEKWFFRKDADVIFALLNDLERNKWKHAFLSNKSDQGKSDKIYLDLNQVHDAARDLRKKTKGYLTWKAAADGYLYWQSLLP